MLYSPSTKRIYIGYTVDFERRIMQHNGLLAGGAKKTRTGRPWIPIINLNGFMDNHQALRFEFRWQRMTNRAPKKYRSLLPKNKINRAISIMNILISLKDGSGEDKISWGIKLINFY